MSYTERGGVKVEAGEKDRAGTAAASAGADFAFGTLNAPAPEPIQGQQRKFRIAILGDFSGRASRGEVEIGAALGTRKPIRFDVDNIDEVIARFRTTLSLPIGADGAVVDVELGSVDDLHPDELYESVEIFEELGNLRRRLASGRGVDAAIAEMRGWAEAFGDIQPMPRRRAKGSAVPADRKLNDFQKLIGDISGRRTEPTSVDDIIARIVGPHVVAAPDPRQESMLAAVDAALSDAMRRVLHHPDFQAVEATWRSLELIARRVETGGGLEIVLYDVSAEEWAADLSAQEELSESGLFEMLAEAPRLDERQGPIAAIFGLYTLQETPPHAELLARMARIAAHMNAAFVAAISPKFLETPKDERHPLVRATWDALREMPEARHVAIAAPRFLLRLPYGKRTEPVDPFDFEEFTLRDGLKGMLWSNPAVLVAILLAETVRQGGRSPRLGQIMSVGDMPFHYMTDRFGDQVALPCTERLLNTRTAAEVVARGIMPVLSIQGRNEIRLGSFQSLGADELAGPWADGSAGVASGPGARMKAGFGFKSGAAKASADGTAVAAAAAGAEEGEGDEDLDALLGGLGEDSGPDPEDGNSEDLDELLSGLDDADAGGGDASDDDLDALLAGFGDDDAGDAGDDEMDPDLAALLEGL